MTRAKPDLYLDVDGVLCAFPKGYQGRKVDLGEDCAQLFPTNDTKAFMNWAWRQFDVLWCTAWGDRANRIASWAGLPDIGWVSHPRSRDPQWKLSGVKARRSLYPDRAALWVEDGIGEEGNTWLLEQSGLLYVHTDPYVGVTKAHALMVADVLGLSMEGWQ